MNPIVVDIEGKYACVLTDDGQFLKIKNKNYQIGEYVELPTVQKSFAHNWFRQLATAMAVVVVVLGGGAGVYAYPYGSVSLDVNPSINYTINIFDRVIGVDGINDDGSVITESLNVKNMNINEAIASTITTLQSNNYLTDLEDNYVVVAVNTKSEEHSKSVVSSVETSLASDESVSVLTTVASDEDVKEAKDLNTSPGKMWIVKKAKEDSEDEMDVEEWVNHSVKDIINHSKQEKDEMDDEFEIDDREDDENEWDEEDIPEIEKEQDQKVTTAPDKGAVEPVVPKESTVPSNQNQKEEPVEEMEEKEEREEEIAEKQNEAFEEQREEFEERQEEFEEKQQEMYEEMEDDEDDEQEDSEFPKENEGPMNDPSNTPGERENRN